MRRARNEEWRTKYGSLYRKYVGRLIIRRGGKRDRERESSSPSNRPGHHPPRFNPPLDDQTTAVATEVLSSFPSRPRPRGDSLHEGGVAFFHLLRFLSSAWVVVWIIMIEREREREDGWLSLRGGLFIGSSVSRIHV